MPRPVGLYDATAKLPLTICQRGSAFSERKSAKITGISDAGGVLHIIQNDADIGAAIFLSKCCRRGWGFRLLAGVIWPRHA
jgi:hypothetical protein